MRALTAVAIAVVLAGCASAPPATSPGAGQVFTGEVWTWDEPNSTVTLFKDGRIQRVKVSPEELRTLRLHEYTRVVGQLAPPADMPVTVALGPTTPVPKGQAETLEVAGTVSTVDPAGRMAITSNRGPLHVWVAQGADQRFAKGAPVNVRISVQPIDMVPLRPGQVVPAASSPVAASPSSEPGDHAVVTGRIIGVNPGGVLVVESPTGPIQVLVGDGSKYKVGEFAEIRTSVRTAS